MIDRLSRMDAKRTRRILDDRSEHPRRIFQFVAQHTHDCTEVLLFTNYIEAKSRWRELHWRGVPCEKIVFFDLAPWSEGKDFGERKGEETVYAKAKSLRKEFA